MHISELLDHDQQPESAWTTGFAELDRVTGGFSLGQLWVITGAPGSGRSTLLTQFVHMLAAEHGFATTFHSAGWDTSDVVGGRFRALAGRIPRHLTPSALAGMSLTERQIATMAALREADLDVDLGSGWFTKPSSKGSPRRCLAVDEPEFDRPPVLEREGRVELRRFADDSGIVLVTVPRSHCIDPTGPLDRLREEWASVADVMVETHLIDDLGKTELRVIRNRRGPTSVVDTIHEGYYARFVER